MTTTDPNPTVEMPATPVRVAAGPPPSSGLGSDRDVDELLAALAVPLPDGPMLADRLMDLWSELTNAPYKAALCTAWVFAAIVLAVTWIAQPVVAVQTSFGPARVSCGIDVFVYGYPDRSVAKACTRAETVHFALFVPATLVIMAGIVAACVLAFRRYVRLRSTESEAVSFLQRLLEARLRAALTLFGAIAAAVGLFALRPVPLTLARPGVLMSVRCGADTYFDGYPDSRVRTACTRAYSGHAHVLEVAAVLTLVGIVTLLQVAYSSATERGKRRLTVALVAGLLTIVAVVALRPVEVEVVGGTAPVVANCGIDTFLVGYPEHDVQTACRSHYAGRAAVGLTAGALSLIVIGAGMARSDGRRRIPGPVREEVPA